MKKSLLSFVLVFVLFNVLVFAAHSCKLPQGEYLTIACTKKCPNTYINALKESARELHYKIQLKILNNHHSNYSKILSSVDGILSPGGHDIDPKYYPASLSQTEKDRIMRLFKQYGKSSDKGLIRDRFEYNLFKQYISDDRYKHLPVLGVCYGMQMLALVKGIPLYVDITKEIHVSARRKVHDTIMLSGSTPFTRTLKKQYITGYKNHHQAVDLNYYNYYKRTRFSDVTISGVSNHGKIAEILEFRDRPMLGLQFHPERSVKETRRAVYNYFLINACKNKRSKSEKGKRSNDIVTNN